ncbi:glycine betaine ABC transporter substrate-binding protein [Gracilibacillus timonensis]|uniref:glycine betaine ABC transporter substrate-binding protein n=1 Tax=Gracilibacillus timonensis TaxID=1816696 RepID=UPI0008261770|nr:glycine betaine ABC transporter substrate-binding protein [Gracilibacillus timonensis]
MIKNVKLFGFIAVLALVMLLAACGGSGDEEDAGSGDNGDTDNGSESADGAELGETDLTVPYVAWAGALARTPLLKQVLEEVGYTVEDTQVEAGAMWSSVASGDAAFMTASWLPATHASYWEEYEDDVEVVGEFVAQAPLALTVPSYMEDVNSIEDLQGNEELGESVDWTITGIDSGAGIMQNTETAIEEYGLDNWELLASSEAAMLSELQSKMDNEEPIIVPLWEPHWAFAELDLKMLEDPQEIYGGDGDRIEAVANTTFQEDSPAAYEVVQRFTEDYNGEIENDLLVAINGGESEEDAASQFLEENPDLLEKWTEGLGE